MQTQSEREARMRQLIAQHSRDSAIGADSLEWETENLEFDSSQLVNVSKYMPLLRIICTLTCNTL